MYLPNTWVEIMVIATFRLSFLYLRNAHIFVFSKLVITVICTLAGPCLQSFSINAREARPGRNMKIWL